MVRFLTDAWLDALDDAASSITLDDAVALQVEHVVGAFTYHVTYEGGRVRFAPGSVASPTVRLVADRTTAAAIAQGTLSAQRAFMNGLLRIDGDTLALANAQPALRELGDVFAAVRDRTEW